MRRRGPVSIARSFASPLIFKSLFAALRACFLVDAEGRPAVAAGPGFFFSFEVGVESVLFHPFKVGNGTVLVFVDVVLIEQFHLFTGKLLTLVAIGEFSLFMFGTVPDDAA